MTWYVLVGHMKLFSQLLNGQNPGSIKKKKKLVTKASSWIIYISKLTHPWKTSKSTMAIALLFGSFLDIFLPSLQHEVVLKGKRGPLYI